MGTHHRDFDVSRAMVIVLAGCFGCNSSQSAATKDAGGDRGQVGSPDANQGGNRDSSVANVSDAPSSPDLAVRDLSDATLASPDLAKVPPLAVDSAIVDLASSTLAEVDGAGKDSGKDAPAANARDVAMDGVSALDGAKVDQSGAGLDTGGIDNVGEAGSTAMVDPFAGVELKPDTDTTPVVSCVGQADMTLCNVVTNPDRWYDICLGGTCVSPGCGDVSCNAPAPHFPIPANSNRSHLQIISTGSEPMVADLVTGLHWQGCDVGRSGQDCTAGTSKQMNWQDSVAYCDALSWGGKDDWYLPDSYELMSIVDWAKSGDTGVTIDPAVFPHSSYAYWTSHIDTYFTTYAIQFRFTDPVILDDGGRTSGTYYVRCVRRGFSRNAAFTGTRFASSTVGSQKIITDPATGLIWQGRSGGSMPMAKWVSYCDSLNWAGVSDWRLPTFKELHSIDQYPSSANRAGPRIDGNVFDVYGRYAIGTRSGWQDNAITFLFDVDRPAITFLSLTPNESFPIICVRGQ